MINYIYIASPSRSVSSTLAPSFPPPSSKPAEPESRHTMPSHAAPTRSASSSASQACNAG
ncbi:hypothetical protein Sjap_006817 [Stephania japonica]|uniref:Uncharacterized protein n=1 Tax=Stephania japonica TaxID=461633 RepID=A0AAP0K8D5_9MAGN